MGSRRGGVDRGVGAEEQADGDREAEGQRDREARHDRVPVRERRDAPGDAEAQQHARDAARERDHDRLGEELAPDVPARGADGAAHADLARPLEHGGQHDVHDADAAHEQRDAGDAAHDHVEQPLRLPALLEQLLGHDQLVVGSPPCRRSSTLDAARGRARPRLRVRPAARSVELATRAAGGRTSSARS